MKLTTKQLKQIIQEELNALMESPSEYKASPEDYMDASIEKLKGMVEKLMRDVGVLEPIHMRKSNFRYMLGGGGHYQSYKEYFKYIKPIEMTWIHAIRRMAQAKKVANSYSDDAWLMHRTFSPPILDPENIDYLHWLGTTLIEYHAWAGTDPNAAIGVPRKIQYPFAEARTAILKYMKLYFPEGDWYDRSWSHRAYSDRWLKWDKV